MAALSQMKYESQEARLTAKQAEEMAWDAWQAMQSIAVIAYYVGEPAHEKHPEHLIAGIEILAKTGAMLMERTHDFLTHVEFMEKQQAEQA